MAGVSLVLSALGDEEQTLAGLAGPGGDGVGNSGLLVLVELGQLLGLNSLIVEVEETLGEAQAPARKSILLATSSKAAATLRRIFHLLDQTRGLVAEGALSRGLDLLLGSLGGLSNFRSGSGLLSLLLGGLNGGLSSSSRSLNNGLSSRDDRGGLLNGLLSVRHD